MDQNMKRLPYGINDFEAVIEQNQYYVDKTMYLPLLENQPSNIFFIRPRRFGKSSGRVVTQVDQSSNSSSSVRQFK